MRLSIDKRIFGDGWAQIASFDVDSRFTVVRARIGTEDNTADHAIAELRFRQGGMTIGSTQIAGATNQTPDVELGVVRGTVIVELRANSSRAISVCDEIEIQPFGADASPDLAGLDPTLHQVGDRYEPLTQADYVGWIVRNQGGSNLWVPYGPLGSSGVSLVSSTVRITYLRDRTPFIFHVELDRGRSLHKIFTQSDIIYDVTSIVSYGELVANPEVRRLANNGTISISVV